MKLKEPLETVHIGHVDWEPVGQILVASSKLGVVAVSLGELNLDAFARKVEKRNFEFITEDEGYNTPIAKQLSEYFQRERRHFDVEIDYRGLTPFQQEVYLQAVATPIGSFTTYGNIAEKLGNPGASRAVGQALARNPIPIFVPCHRVLNKKGQLHGFSAKGGLNTKSLLLQIEGVMLI